MSLLRSGPTTSAMISNRKEADMPPVSESQRRAMYAAKAGKSTLGIPKKVGKEFVKSDKGGKLPNKVSTSKKAK
jgi:hypothetical protein